MVREQLNTAAVDWAAWARRWDAQQGAHVPRREERFRVMLDVAAEVAGGGDGAPEAERGPAGERRWRLMDLASGPGSIAARALARFPSAHVLAVDADPFLIALGKATLSDGGGRLEWVQADLRETAWRERVRRGGPLDAVLSSTALHWLAADEVVELYRALATLIRPGGVFLNADHLLPAVRESRLGSAAEALRTRETEARLREQPAETWGGWWDAARAEPAFAELLAAHDRTFERRPRHSLRLTARFHETALTLAGFSQAAVIWRYFDDAIVAAVR